MCRLGPDTRWYSNTNSHRSSPHFNTPSSTPHTPSNTPSTQLNTPGNPSQTRLRFHLLARSPTPHALDYRKWNAPAKRHDVTTSSQFEAPSKSQEGTRSTQDEARWGFGRQILDGRPTIPRIRSEWTKEAHLPHAPAITTAPLRHHCRHLSSWRHGAGALHGAVHTSLQTVRTQTRYNLTIPL